MDRQFSEKETARILRRAAELQASAPTDASGRISETSLRDAAKELGVDPKFIDEAIRQLEAGQGADNVGFFGGPMQVDIDRTFAGSVTDQHWEDIVLELRKALGEQGKVERRGDTFEWTGTGGGVYATTFVLRQIGDGIRVQANVNMTGLRGMTYALGMVPTLMGVGILGKTMASLGDMRWAVIPLFIIAMFFSARLVFNQWARQISSKIHAVARLAETTCAVSNPALQAASASPVVETEGQGGLEVQQ